MAVSKSVKRKKSRFETWLRIECVKCSNWIFLPFRKCPATARCGVCRAVIDIKAVLKDAENEFKRK